MKPQNYDNHRRFMPSYHGITFFTLLILFIGSIVNLVQSTGDEHRLYNASLIALMAFLLLGFFFFSRGFALRAQDRAIRAEENLRYFALTGKLLPAQLTLRQIIGLRFASDEEFLSLVNRAVQENLSETDIKKAIRNWKADHHRV